MAKNKIKQLPPGTYTQKEYIKYLKESGHAEQVIKSLSTFQEQTMAQAMWDIIQAESKLTRPGERDSAFSKKEIAFLDWAREYNIDLKESLDIIHDKLEQAYDSKRIPEKISRSKLAEILLKYRPKKS